MTDEERSNQEIAELRAELEDARVSLAAAEAERNSLISAMKGIQDECWTVAERGSSYAPFARRVLSLVNDGVSAADAIHSRRVAEVRRARGLGRNP